jgi:hypothetical protein
MIRARGIFPCTALAAAVALGGCAYEIGFQEAYLPQEPPAYLAEGKLLIVMPEEQRVFVYDGPPSSRTGDFTTLRVPIGNIVQQIARHVFGECFAFGVEVTDSREGRDDFVFAIEGDMQEFIYSYTKVIDAGFDSERADVLDRARSGGGFRHQGLQPCGRSRARQSL